MFFINDILILISNFSLVLQYFIPGYISILLFLFITGKRVDRGHTLILSCTLSYIWVILLNALIKTNQTFTVQAISIIGSIIFGIGFAKVYQSKRFKKLLVTRFHKTQHDYIWQDVIDFENGSVLKIYFTNRDYYLIGSYRISENRVENPWMAVSGYAKMDKNNDDIIDDKWLNNDNKYVVFPLKDVEYIEVI